MKKDIKSTKKVKDLVIGLCFCFFFVPGQQDRYGLARLKRLRDEFD